MYQDIIHSASESIDAKTLDVRGCMDPSSGWAQEI